jgi:cell division protein FtsB
MTMMKTVLPRLLVFAVFLLPAAASAQRGDAVYVEDRINQLQQSLSQLTGQIEQLQNRNQQLQQQMEKMRADYDYRIDQLEKGGGGKPPP